MDIFRSMAFLFAVIVSLGVGGCSPMLNVTQSILPEAKPSPTSEPLSAIPTPSFSLDVVREELQNRIESQKTSGFIRDDLWRMVQRFYRQRNYELAWMDLRGLRPYSLMLFESLCDADAEGFYPTDYYPDKILSTFKKTYADASIEPGDLASLDLLITIVFLHYGSDLLNGYTDRATLAPSWRINSAEVDLVSLLETGLEGNRFGEILKDLRPSNSGYIELSKALAHYRKIAQKGGWPTVPGGKSLRKSSKSSRVVVLRKRLAATGDLDETLALDNPEFDDNVTEAVARFQQRHGLEVDGSVGPSTLKALNVSVEERISQISLNLERWRWLPKDLGERYILVNIPAFELHAYDHGKEVLNMAVVVGQEFNNRATTVFTDMMEHVVFRPYWNVPVSIATKEIMPRVNRDPGYLRRHNYEVVSGNRIRQRPGRGNALGLIKFMFPNEFSIYLHDTPKKHLFKKRSRAFSHGCIRVENPVELAKYVFARDPEWSESRIRNKMNRGGTQWVKLPNLIPVYIYYFTAFVEDGSLHFREDLYNQDKTQIQAMKRQQHDTDESHIHRFCTAVQEKGKNATASGNDESPLISSALSN